MSANNAKKKGGAAATPVPTAQQDGADQAANVTNDAAGAASMAAAAAIIKQRSPPQALLLGSASRVAMSSAARFAAGGSSSARQRAGLYVTQGGRAALYAPELDAEAAIAETSNVEKELHEGIASPKNALAHVVVVAKVPMDDIDIDEILASNGVSNTTKSNTNSSTSKPKFIGFNPDVSTALRIDDGKFKLLEEMGLELLYEEGHGRWVAVTLESLAAAAAAHEANLKITPPVVGVVLIKEAVLKQATAVELCVGAKIVFKTSRATLPGKEWLWAANPRAAPGTTPAVVPTYALHFERLRAKKGEVPPQIVLFERELVELRVRAVKRTSSDFGDSVLVSLLSSDSATATIVKVFLNPALLPEDLIFSKLRLSKFALVRQADWQGSASYMVKTFNRISVIEPVIEDAEEQAARGLNFE